MVSASLSVNREESFSLTDSTMDDLSAHERVDWVRQCSHTSFGILIGVGVDHLSEMNQIVQNYRYLLRMKLISNYFEQGHWSSKK